MFPMSLPTVPTTAGESSTWSFQECLLLVGHWCPGRVETADQEAETLSVWRQGCLRKCPTATTQQLQLTLHFLYLHLPGYALSFKIFKVSLKFHPFLKQDNIAVSREVWRGGLLPSKAFWYQGLVAWLESVKSKAGALLWVLSFGLFQKLPSTKNLAPPQKKCSHLCFEL